MGRLTGLARRVPPVVKAAAALVGGAAWLWVSPRYPGVLWQIHRMFQGGDGGSWGTSSALENALNHGVVVVPFCIDPLLILTMVAIPIALLVRLVARAKVRAGQTDPLAPLRHVAETHPTATRRVLAIPAALFLAASSALLGAQVLEGHLSNVLRLGQLSPVYGGVLALFAAVMTVVSRGVYTGTRAGFHALIAPTVDPAEVARSTSEGDITFNAVAVTRETLAAVAAMAALPVVTFLAIQAGHLGDVATQAALAAYVAAAVAGAVAFRRGSRISVGVDGIFVDGTSRARFFAYKDTESVRARGGDIELTQRGHVVLRLQLHGKDAARRDALVTRIAQAIEASRGRQTEAAGQIVASVSSSELERIASGAADYRAAAITRQQLWDLVEGPQEDAATRTAAARALASRGDPEDRMRLRVAAQRSAEPRVRLALAELADDDEGLPGVAVPAARSAAP